MTFIGMQSNIKTKVILEIHLFFCVLVLLVLCYEINRVTVVKFLQLVRGSRYMLVTVDTC